MSKNTDNNSTTTTTCDACGKAATNSWLCGGCRGAGYCGRACQRTAWPTHKQACKKKQQQQQQQNNATSTSKHQQPLFARPLEDFLALQQLHGGPTATLNTVLPTISSPGKTDQQFVALIASGLIPACFQAVLHTASSSRSLGSPEAMTTAKILLKTSIETDICWVYLEAYRYISAAGETSKRWFGVSAQSGQLPSGLREEAIRQASLSSSYNPSCLLGLMVLKLALKGIRILAQHGRHFEQQDPMLTVWLTRLFVRCLHHDQNMLNIPLLTLGASSSSSLAENRNGEWDKASVAARKEYDDGGIASKLITLRALNGILEPPAEQDRRLCRWMLGRSTGTFITLAGWIASGAWKRSPEVAVKAQSWRKLRELLYIGAQGSAVSGALVMTEQEWNDKTVAAVGALQGTGMEQQDGSTTRMPQVVAVSDLVRNPGLVESVHSVRRNSDEYLY